jgi:hypothetical protein
MLLCRRFLATLLGWLPVAPGSSGSYTEGVFDPRATEPGPRRRRNHRPRAPEAERRMPEHVVHDAEPIDRPAHGTVQQRVWRIACACPQAHPRMLAKIRAQPYRARVGVVTHELAQDAQTSRSPVAGDEPEQSRGLALERAVRREGPSRRRGRGADEPGRNAVSDACIELGDRIDSDSPEGKRNPRSPSWWGRTSEPPAARQPLLLHGPPACVGHVGSVAQPPIGSRPCFDWRAARGETQTSRDGRAGDAVHRRGSRRGRFRDHHRVQRGRWT